MRRKILSLSGVVGLAVVCLVISMSALTVHADDRSPSHDMIDQAAGSPQPQIATPDSPAVGELIINEVAPAAAPGKPAWVELAVNAQQLYLPIVVRNSNGASNLTGAANAAASMTSNAAAAPAPAATTSSTYVLNLNGARYQLPAALPTIPPNGFIVIFVGITGTDDLDFGDGVAHLYAAAVPTDVLTLRGGGYVGLYNSLTFSSTTILDFAAWGALPNGATDDAVDAGIWPKDAVLEFDGGFGGEDAISVPTHPDESFGLYAGEWASYRAQHSSRGEPNPPPVPMH